MVQVPLPGIRPPVALALLLAGLIPVWGCVPQGTEDPGWESAGAEAPGPAAWASGPVTDAAGTAAGALPDLSRIATAARGFPALRDLDGRILADGDFEQWSENGRLHTRIRYDFEDGRRIEEETVFLEGGGIVQESWSWTESREGQPLRRFGVDFTAGTATAEKREEGEMKHWSEEIEVEPGRTFAGFGFSVALKAFRERLVGGEVIELEAVAFTPGPRVVRVELSHGGVERMEMADRVLRGDRFDIEPMIPWIAELFIDVPDTRIWLTEPPAVEFLRWEGPLLEPDDPVVRVDLLPGGESGSAEALEAGGEP